jgi:hypothetical protein
MNRAQGLIAPTLIPDYFFREWPRRVNRKGLIDVKAAAQRLG